MQRILVPCDGSANALRAVRHAAEFARKLGDVQLDLLYIEDPVVMRECAAVSDDERQTLQCVEADRVLHEAREALKAAGQPHQEFIRTGPPANEIARHVQENGCDAVIMGTRGRGPLTSVMLGSVATQTVHLVRVPVTLVK